MREIIRDIKVRRVSTIATLAGVLLLTVVGGWSAMQWLFEPSSTSQGNIPEAGLSVPNEVTQPTAVATLSAQPKSTIAPKNITAAKTDSTAIAAVQGLLRVGNPTDHPVRVAVLLKKPSAKDSADQSQTGYEAPAHWDFDPGEGSEKGLLLSLPNRQIKLKKGDILVAFAQDGSRRYWGPYVVGETSIPAWTTKTAEWRLTLQP